MTRILLLKNNILNQDVLDNGIFLVTKWCATIGLPLTFIPQVTNRQFTSLPFSNNTNKNGYQVNPREIFEECAKVNFKFDSDSVVCLVYDSLKITPNPTNPIDDGLCMQIPQNWYASSPDVFAFYFCHELCHFYSALKGVKDMTHLMTDMTLDPVTYLKFAQKQPQDYYLYLLSTLIKPMPTVTITRTIDNGIETLGTLTAYNGSTTFECKTLERPWKNNQRNISCIPKGNYTCKYTFSLGKLGWTYEVQNVSNRSGIRIHTGNYWFDVEGCIALGNNYQDINGDKQLDVINSKLTIASFVALMGKKPFTLIIQ